MRNFRRLNSRGASHIIALMGVIVISGIVGSYMLVASHADSCGGTSDPASSATSAPSCTPVSGPVSGPASGPQLSCVIQGVPENPSYGTVLHPTVTITNTGDQAATGITASEGFGVSDGQGNGKGGATPVNIPDIAPGLSYTGTLSSYTVPYASSTARKASYGVSSTSPSFNCDAYFSLPVEPLSYMAKCSISGIGDSVQVNSSLTPQLTVTNTGSGSITPAFNYYYTAQSIGKSADKTVTMGGIPGGASSSISLDAYVPTTKFTDTYNLNVVSNTKGIDFTCTKSFTVTVPVIRSLTLQASDWQRLFQGSIVKDGSHGNVAKLNYSSHKTGVSTVFADGTATSAYPHGTPLTKLSDFVQADFGRNATVCANVRSNPSIATHTLLTVKNFSSSSSTGFVSSKSLTTGSSYASKCFNFTIISKSDYLGRNPAYTPADVQVGNGSYGSVLYVSSVTLNLQ